MNTISGRLGPAAIALPRMPAQPAAGEAAGGSFKDALLKSLDEVNQLQHQANQAVESLATGGAVNPAEVLTAVQKADLAFRMVMQVRNKLVSAYQEIQNVRV